MRYHLNKEARTVRQVWQYGKERGSEFFSPHISNIFYYGPDHYLVHSGDIGQIAGKPCVKPPIFYIGKPEEKDLLYYSITTEVKDNNVVYEMKMPSTAYFRARKESLYDARDVLSFGAGDQLGSLGVSATIRLRTPKKVHSLPETMPIRIEDEIDRFRIALTLDVGTYACLVLQQEETQHVYLIPTTEADELAMCIKTLQPDNANETFVTISKSGLSGAITPAGMRLLGIFIAFIYGLTVTSCRYAFHSRSHSADFNSNAVAKRICHCSNE